MFSRENSVNVSVNVPLFHRVCYLTKITLLIHQLRIDRGSPGGAAHSGTCIHSYGSWIGILYIFRKIIFFSTQWYKYNFSRPKFIQIMNLK